MPGPPICAPVLLLGCWPPGPPTPPSAACPAQIKVTADAPAVVRSGGCFTGKAPTFKTTGAIRVGGVDDHDVTAAAAGVGWLAAYGMDKLQGGLTGDSYGALCEISEIALLAGFTAAQRLILFPFWEIFFP